MGWGRAEHPSPRNLQPNLEGRGGEVGREEGHRRRRHRARGRVAGRPRPGTEARRGRRGRASRTAESRLSHPTAASARHPQPSRAAPRPGTPGRPPDPTARGGAPSRRLSLPPFPSGAAEGEHKVREPRQAQGQPCRFVWVSEGIVSSANFGVLIVLTLVY